MASKRSRGTRGRDVGRRTGRRAGVALAALVVAALASSCGGGGGGSVASGGSGRGLILLTFQQEGLDNVALNERLRFTFSDTVAPWSVTSQTFQIRRGSAFGQTVGGTFHVSGTEVRFDPDLPSLCDLSDAGFEADTQYRVQLVGHPEEFSVRNAAGQALSSTRTSEFHTRVDTDPALFTDQAPGAQPMVLASSPQNGSEAVAVQDGNRVVVTLSENLRPCSITDQSVRFHIYQFGNAAVTAPANNGAGPATGFATGTGETADLTGSPFTWGTAAEMPGIITLPMPQKILAHIELDQSFDKTELVITPSFGYHPNPLFNKSRFPENALIVLELTFDVLDFGGSPLTPFVLAFTTENLPPQSGTYVVENQGETPWDDSVTTARVIETAPGVVQGFMLFSGDGDNGADQLRPSLPQVGPACTIDLQANDGTGDNFAPTGDVLLDTGSSINPCENSTDGSYAVVWEFKTLHIPNGVTVRILGINPAILLVQGDARIDAGGRLLARGDGGAGAPQGKGQGNLNATQTVGAKGGIGVAGGGDGGASLGGNGAGSARYGGSGFTGYFHTTPTGPVDGDVGTAGGVGAGEGNSSGYWSSQTNPNNRNTPGGGGGGHAAKGDPGLAKGSGTAPTSIDLPLKGGGGDVYGDNASRLLTPEAGSGGGAGGELRPFTGNTGRGPGGGGGAGGGFVDVTAGGDLVVLGTIDAAGSTGGSHPGGTFNPNYSWQPGTGGGGGGSGGGIRLLTPRDIIVGPTTVITAAGGSGGAGGASQGTDPGLCNGGAGGAGRIALEDSNSIITGFVGAGISPGEGNAGFYRGVFDSTRFKGGGLTPSATTEIFAAGPFNPVYTVPVQTYPSATDFLVGAPTVAVRGPAKPVMLIEMRGYQMLPDGAVDLTGVIALPTDWHTIGYFRDSGVEFQPTWVVGQPALADIGGALPDGNLGVVGIANLDGCEYIQIRVTMYLSTSIGPTDPGHFLDRWTLRFTSDN